MFFRILDGCYSVDLLAGAAAHRFSGMDLLDSPGSDIGGAPSTPRPSSSGGAYLTHFMSQIAQGETPFPVPLFNPRADQDSQEEAHFRSTPPHPWPARMFKTWWWVCKCENTHCVEVNPMIQHSVAVGAGGCPHDLIRPCGCWHTLCFGKDRNMIRQALNDAMIPPSVFYTLIPVWGYAGSPDEMRFDQGTLMFRKKSSAFPHHRVLVSNWLEIPDMAEASFLTWRHNTKWMRQVATMRRIMSEAARSDGLIQEGHFISKVLMTLLI